MIACRFLSCLLVATTLLASSLLFAQSPDKIRLFFDCSLCDADDFDFFRTELRFVDFVREREEADVHLIVTSEETGGGGEEFTITIIGRQRFNGMDDTLRYVSEQSETTDFIRTGMVNVMKIGLMRYVAKSSAAGDITIGYKALDTTAAPASEPSIDRWKNWVFSISGNGYFTGEKTYKNHYLYGSISASRVTEGFKFGLSVSGNYEKDKYDTGDRIIEGHSSSKSGSVYGIFSLSDHWSDRFGVGVSTSMYNNQDLRLSGSAAVEYNIFPYRISTHKQLRLSYWLAAYYNDYHEETIYLKTHESLLYHSIQATVEFTQPWGNAEVSAYASNYFQSIRRNRLQGWCDISVRVVKGLSVTFYANAQRIRDLISLPKGGASDDEIFLRLQQIETSYYYYASIGLNYTFGSVYNNIVNPRFGS